MELPPRARRIQPVLPKNWFVQGTTSACAENTGLDHLANSIDRNYLRVRGEYQGHGILPGRWGNYLRVRGEYQGHGILPGRWGNYLRVRGEYPKQCHKERLIRELPPRARRIQISAGDAADLQGTTSACAENTYQRLCRRRRSMNYLRVRGEYPRCSE